MNQRFTYSIPTHALPFPATADRICVAEPRPHTYGVRHLPCNPLATEPCRPTVCDPCGYPRLTARYSLFPAHSTDATPARPAHPILHSSFFILNWTYTFSAKEKDSETGLSYFGSRYHSSDLSIWLNVDPMAAKYPGLSPYTYCANNPVKLVDPNGETWDTPEDEKKANELISKAEEQILQYKEQIQRCYARYDRFKNPQKKNDELKKIDFLNVLIDEVQKGIDGLNQMCEDEYYYHFVEIGRGRNCYSKKEVRGPKDVHIIIYSDDLIETRWHECKHIQDWLNKVFPGEEHDFGKDNTLGNSNEDVETSAYRSEFAFSRRRFDGQCLIKQGNINDIQGDQRVKKR